MCPEEGAKSRGRRDNRDKNLVILAEPSQEELRPSEEARKEMQRLLNWEKRSEKRDWIVGRPFE